MISKINEFYLNIFGIYILKKYIYLIIVGIATQLRSNLEVGTVNLSLSLLCFDGDVLYRAF
jgi:hypothetical protein